MSVIDRLDTPTGVQAVKVLFDDILKENEKLRRDVRAAYLDRKKLRSRVASNDHTIRAFQEEREGQLDDLKRMKDGLYKIEVTAPDEGTREIARRARLGW